MTPSPSPGAPSPPPLEAQGVNVCTLDNPDRIILREVNWTVSAGDYWVIVGLHYSGKSDLLALAAGLNRPAAGSLRLFGVELAAAREHDQVAARTKVGFVFERGHLLHQLSLAENVALPLCYHLNRSPEDVWPGLEALLDATGLVPVATLAPARVGRNLQRRTALARALALQPELLLLDNPLSGLDFQEARWWLDFLNQLAAGHPVLNGRPVTIAVTVDNLRPWKDCGRQFALLSGERFVARDSWAGLHALPEPLLRELLNAGLD